ncbi:MAG: FHA domain-containing protein [Firmicutes bacterium]|jgi:hypothetical protein|nr:FHA domain-containing protein [Bacillota bacterium]
MDNNLKKCILCGHLNTVDANYCSSCGTALNKLTDNTLICAPDISFEEPLGGEESLSGLDLQGAVLVVKMDQDVLMPYQIDKEVTTIGRKTDSDIFLDDITVSRNHAVVERRADATKFTYHLKDVGSLNGTYVNRKRIEEIELFGGEEVQVGKFKLVYMAQQPN